MISGICLLAAACLCPALQDRKPVPEAAAVKESQQLLRDLFKADYARKGAPDRLALSRKLLQQGLAANDEAAMQYVLLTEAREVASLAGDVPGALKAVTELVLRFEVNGPELRLGVLTGAAKSAQSAEDFATIGRAFLLLADEALALRDFEAADKAADQAKTLSRKAKDPALAAKADAKEKETGEFLARLLKAKKARTTLETSPEDPAANAAVGQFECLLKGTWAEGLPLLVKGTEGPLRAAALRDDAGPTDPLEQVQTGDAWWDLAEKETGISRSNLRSRAAHWYERAIPTLSGIQKAKAEKRALSLRQEALFRGTWVELPDPWLFGQRGRSGDALELNPAAGITAGTSEAKLPKGDFDGVSVRMRFKPESTAIGLLVYQGKFAAALLDLKKATLSAVALKNEFWHENQKGACPRQDEYLVTVLFEGGEHVYYLDGKEQFRWKAEGVVHGLKFEANGGPVSFDQIRIRARN